MLKYLFKLRPQFLSSLFTRLYAYFFYKVRSSRGVIISRRSFFEGNNIVLEDSKIIDCNVGRYTYFAPNTLISKSKIGRYCSIGSCVKIGVGIHPKNFVSTHPLFHSKKTSSSLGFKVFKDVNEEFKTHKFSKDGYLVEIGSDVWIGDRVVIMDGLKIGDGAIIGTGAIVTRDVKNYEIVAGVPARHLGYRFSKSAIKELTKFMWWNKPEDWIKENASYFKKYSEFKKFISKS